MGCGRSSSAAPTAVAGGGAGNKGSGGCRFTLGEDPRLTTIRLSKDGSDGDAAATVGLVSDSLAYCLLVAPGDGVLFIDARGQSEYDAGHLVGAWCVDRLTKQADGVKEKGGGTGGNNGVAHTVAAGSRVQTASGAKSGAPSTQAAGAAHSWEAALRSRCGLRTVVICGRCSAGDLQRDEDVKRTLQMLKSAGARPKEPLLVLGDGVSAFARRFGFCMRGSGGDKAQPLPLCPTEVLPPGWGGGSSRPPALYLGPTACAFSGLASSSAATSAASVLDELRVRSVVLVGGGADLGAATKRRLRCKTVKAAPPPNPRAAAGAPSDDEEQIALASDACSKLGRQSAACLLCGDGWVAGLAAALFLAQVLPPTMVESVDQVLAFLRQRCPSAADFGVPGRLALGRAIAARHGWPPPEAEGASTQDVASTSAALAVQAAAPAVAPPAGSTGTAAAAALCQRLLKRDPTGGRVALATVQTALQNVVGKPADAKLRRLKSSNDRVQREVMAHTEAVELLLLAGWVRDRAGDLVLPETVPVQASRDVLAGLPLAPSSAGSAHTGTKPVRVAPPSNGRH